MGYGHMLNSKNISNKFGIQNEDSEEVPKNLINSNKKRIFKSM